VYCDGRWEDIYRGRYKNSEGNEDMRFVVVFWVVMSCDLVGGYNITPSSLLILKLFKTLYQPQTSCSVG
jgi:hypothetical protein